MGSALMGSLQISCFVDRGFFWVPICQNLSISVNFAYLFPQSVKINYFCSDPISVDPICPQPTSARLELLIIIITITISINHYHSYYYDYIIDTSTIAIINVII